MKASIPRRREEIKEASMSELKDFLENIRKFSPKIGEMAMRNTAVKLNMDPSGMGNHEQPKKQGWNSMHLEMPQKNIAKVQFDK